MTVQVQLNKASQKRLAQIAEYIRHNQDIDLVLVSTYTSNEESKSASQNLSEQRAEVLRDYFKSLGLPEDRIQVQINRRRPSQTLFTAVDKNRRVVISLGRTKSDSKKAAQCWLFYCSFLLSRNLAIRLQLVAVSMSCAISLSWIRVSLHELDQRLLTAH